MKRDYCDHCGVELVREYQTLKVSDINLQLCKKDAQEIKEYLNKYFSLPSHQPQMYHTLIVNPGEAAQQSVHLTAFGVGMRARFAKLFVRFGLWLARIGGK